MHPADHHRVDGPAQTEGKTMRTIYFPVTDTEARRIVANGFKDVNFRSDNERAVRDASPVTAETDADADAIWY